MANKPHKKPLGSALLAARTVKLAAVAERAAIRKPQPAPVDQAITTSQSQVAPAVEVMQPPADPVVPVTTEAAPAPEASLHETVPLAPVNTPSETEADANRRKAPRKNSSIPAQIVYASSTQYVPCKIADMSATGARLTLEKEAPDYAKTLTLFMTKDRVQVSCQIIRRTETELGVRFLTALQPY